MSVADELLKCKELLESGAITQEEFNSMKKRILREESDKVNNYYKNTTNANDKKNYNASSGNASDMWNDGQQSGNANDL